MSGVMRRALAFVLCLLIGACAEAPVADPSEAVISRDPVIARALGDPLMSDPDLASRNEANAVVAINDGGALPVLRGSPEAARAARDAARLDLLDGGAIPDLPAPSRAPRAALPAANTGAAALLDALGAPRGCAAQLAENFAFAANLAGAAVIMPHAMVMQAAGSDAPGCKLRIVRYRTAATGEDVLQYHHARALRAGLRAQRHARPDALTASGPRGARLIVIVRPAVHGLNAVDLLYRAA
jgi:hypothetical protein